MEAAHLPWRPLGELFVARGLITEAELETALAEQAATSKRLGEILVDRGLVSGPDLTSVLMEQLGVEISKEEGFGSGLWAEIKRRHRRSGGDEAGGYVDGPEGSLVVFPGAFESDEPEATAPVTVPVAGELDSELEGLAADYTPPPLFGTAPDPSAADASLEPVDEEWFVGESEESFAAGGPFAGGPVVDEPVSAGPVVEMPIVAEPVVEEPLSVEAFVEAPAASVENDGLTDFDDAEQPGPESAAADPSEMDFEAWPEPAPEPDLAAEATDPDEAASLRSELAAARTEIEQLHEMLADAMTALTALAAEAQAAVQVAPHEHDPV